MKLTCFLLFIGFMQVGAKGSAQTITWSGKNASVKKVFSVIKNQTGYVFFYNYSVLKDSKPVSIDVKDAPLERVLQLISDNQPFSFSIVGKTIVVSKRTIPFPDKIDDVVKEMKDPPQRVLQGKIINDEGGPLVGVTIRIQGTDNGTVSDASGTFKIEISDNAILEVSYIGFQSQEVQVGEKNNIIIQMHPLASGLNQIVVVGYGTQKNKDLTGAIGTISMKNIQDQAVTGADQLLTGQVSGVQVTQPAGIPGGGPTIQIRGIGAIGAGSQPLYVVDGFPLPRSSSVMSNPLNNILPEDIASISVLKDASATAIYGSRGANGVVLIETKKGSAGKMQIQISASRGTQVIPKKGRPDLMNAREFAQWRKDAITSDIRYEQGREPTLDDIPLEYRDPQQYGKGTDWFEEVTRVAPMEEFRFSVSGGNELIKSYISGGYLKQDGVVIGTDYSRFSFRANVDANIHDKVKVGLNLAPTFSKQNLSSVGGNGRNEPGFGYALSASPIPSVYNDDGTFIPMISSTNTFSFANPLMVVQELKNESQVFHGIVNGFIQYNPLKSLTLKSAINLAYSNTQSSQFHPSYIGGTNQSPPVIPSGQFGSPSYLNSDFENTIAYQNEFGQGHNISAVAGYTFQKNSSTSATFNGRDYPSDDVETLNAAATITGSTTEEEWSLISYFARLSYSYQDKYLLTGTFRRDGSSRFGGNNKWGGFPSGSLGWRISEEPFMKSVKWITELKLRASYGITGNFNIGDYAYVSHIGTSDYVLGGSRAPGQILTSLGNPDLKWERSREINIGLDAGLWNGRLSLTADLYKRNTVDMLLNDEVPSSSGFSEVIVNRGNIVNRGLELGITSVNLGSGSQVKWNTNLTFTINRNKVLALGNSGAPIYAGFGGGGEASNITMIGKPVGMFFGWDLLGLYQNEADIKNSPSYPTVVPGDLKFRDVNGDGKLTEFDDFTIIGNPYPDFTWGMTNVFDYKNFNLRVLLTGSYGGEMYREDHHYYHNTDGVFNVSRDQLKAWKSLDDPGNGKVPNNAGSESRRFYRMVNSGALENNTYLWIKNVTLGYDLLNKLKDISNIHIYLSVQNAVLFTGYGGSNPEGSNYNASSGDGVLAPGLDFVSYPVPRIITLGVELSL